MKKSRTPGLDDGAWEELLPEPARLTGVEVEGDGQRCNLTVSLADGRWVSVAARSVDLSVEGRWDPVSDVRWTDDDCVSLTYAGKDLEVRSLRLCEGSADADFHGAVEGWRAQGMAGEIWFVVDAEVVLAPAADL